MPEILTRSVPNTPDTMPVGTRIMHAARGTLGRVTGWTSDGRSLAVEWDNGGSCVAPASHRSYMLVVEGHADQDH